MKNPEHIQEEIITILALILTLAFTASYLTPELFEDNSSTESLTFTEASN